MADYDLGRVFRDRQLNAVLAWGNVGVLLVVTVVQAVTGDYLSAVFALTVAVLGSIPSVRFKTPTVTLPWEVLLMASLPTIVRAFATWPVAGSLATYLAVAALALIVAVELHAFTSVRMTYGFALLFVVVTTLAAAGGWAVVRYQFDLLFGTTFITSEKALMWEFVWSTVAGVIAGGVFRFYFQRDAFVGRIPEATTGQMFDPREEST